MPGSAAAGRGCIVAAMGHRMTSLVVSLIVAAAPAVARAQPGPKPPMPPIFFSTTKLNDHL